MTKKEAEIAIMNILNEYIKDKQIKEIELFFTKKRDKEVIVKILDVLLYLNQNQ